VNILSAQPLIMHTIDTLQLCPINSQLIISGMQLKPNLKILYNENLRPMGDHSTPIPGKPVNPIGDSIRLESYSYSTESLEDQTC
jgi:hypothetical protein